MVRRGALAGVLLVAALHVAQAEQDDPLGANIEQNSPRRHLQGKAKKKKPRFPSLHTANATEERPFYCPFPRRKDSVGADFNVRSRELTWSTNPPRNPSEDPHLAMGESAQLREDVDWLTRADLDCLELCIADARHGARDQCAACVEEEERRKRRAMKEVMMANVGCARPETPADGCYTTVKTAYFGGAKDSSAAFFQDGYWSVPEQYRKSEGAVLAKCRDCMPTDGIGSIMTFSYMLLAAALESGCTYVAAMPERVAHGVPTAQLEDFFRADAGCMLDTDPSLEKVKPAALPGEAAALRTPDGRVHLNPNTIYYATRPWIMGASINFAHRLNMPRGSQYFCHRRHASMLARLFLRGRVEAAQQRTLPPGVSAPEFVRRQEDKSSTQLEQSTWFDPLRQDPDGTLVLNVVMHVRLGDVAEKLEKHGMYRLHYTPFAILTAALEVLRNMWLPLAAKLGVRFAFYVASEGDVAMFPVKEWKAILAPHELHLKLRQYVDVKSVAVYEEAAVAANISALQTVGNMMGADVILGDGKSLFSLAGRTFGLHSVFLSYPWLLNMGEPLEIAIRKKKGDIDAPMPGAKVTGWPMHEAYIKMRHASPDALYHPGVRFVRYMHGSEDFRTELEMLYRHRQEYVLQGMLVQLVERKRLAVERGVHFTVGY